MGTYVCRFIWQVKRNLESVVGSERRVSYEVGGRVVARTSSFSNKPLHADL